MTWIPRHLTREQMEERRLKGAQLLKAGKLSQAEIARQLGVSRTAVTHWAQQLDTGQSLQRRVAPGRPPKLTPAQQHTLKQLLKRGACAAGFSTERWTLGRIQQVIEHEFGVTYQEHSLSAVFAGLGGSLQQPLARAQERDAEIIQAWLAHDWPGIKKRRGDVASTSCFSLNLAQPFWTGCGALGPRVVNGRSSIGSRVRAVS